MSGDVKIINDARSFIDTVRASRSAARLGRQEAGDAAVPSRDPSVQPSRLRVSVEEAVERSTVDTVDGSVEITIADDRMSASASFYPPRGFGRPIEPGTVHEHLAMCGVTYGINANVIDAAVETCNLEHSALHAIEVAFGQEPQDEVPEHVELVDRDRAAHGSDSDEADAEAGGSDRGSDRGSDGGGSRIDHRSRSTFVFVREGDIVARVIPAVEGRAGCTVTGEQIANSTTRVPNLVAGANTVLSDGDVVAGVSGLLKVENGEISVSPTIVLRDGVDYGTGNIDFDGDVLLSGRIADGFTVRCSGTLHAATSIDAFGVTCGGLVCAQGVIGRTSEPTVVRGNARMRFAQNARLDVDGTLQIAQSALKSHLTAHERIEFGPRSTVIGCTLRASIGALVYDLGAPGAAVSEVYLGIDFAVDERLAEIRDQTLELSKRLRDVKLAKRHDPTNVELPQVESEIEVTIAALADEACELVVQLDREEDAELVVHGTVYAGTYIEICHRSYLVERTMTRCRFRVDRPRGAVIVEPLSEPGRGR